MSMTIDIYKDTNFGNNDLVWNVPSNTYDFSDHTKIQFTNVQMRFPLLTTRIVVSGNYNFNTAFYDYMIITDGETKTYYFINAIIADRGVLIFSVTLDVITTHNMTTKPISGTLIRRHDVRSIENKFDYPTALNITPNYETQIYDVVGYGTTVTRLIESTINLSNISEAVTLTSDDSSTIVIPVLSKPEHTTEFTVEGFGTTEVDDTSYAFTLYLHDSIDDDILNTVRGLAGDGAISDSYAVPNDAISVTNSGAEVTKIIGQFLVKTMAMKLEIDFSTLGYTPKNEAIKGMFSVTIMSLQDKTRMTFPAWDMQSSVDNDNYIQVNLWCEPKPSGAPYCCPTQLESLDPFQESNITNLATMETKSVRGGQWLRSPLIYDTARGEIFSTIETRLQRERADYEKQVSLHQLEMSKRERDIRIAQSDYAYSSGLASNIINGGASLFSGDFAGLFNTGKNILDANVSQQFTKQLQDLQQYEQQAEKTLIDMAHTNNLKNLDVQETIRRVVPRDILFAPNESLGSYEGYNGFAVILNIPDLETLKAKDLEYTLYGYPVYQVVSSFVMNSNLRKNHTVFQFENPIIEVGGKNGDMIREVLKSGIRILSKPYTIANLTDNPKNT